MAQSSFLPYARLTHTQPRLLLSLCAALFSIGACAGGGEEEACVPEPLAACQASMNTDFASLYKGIIQQRCGTAGGACHSATGRQGNLAMADEQSAYNALLGMDGTHARVIAGAPSCSDLVQRLDSNDPGKRMPYLETNLPEGMRCAVRQWVENGAAR